MSSKEVLCQICAEKNYKYVCPKCNILYCSVNCYKSNTHLQCSEKFYKQWVEDTADMGQMPQSSKEDMQKIYKKYCELDPTMGPLDSDDDFTEEDEADLAIRMAGVDLDNKAKVWAKLTRKERTDFLSKCENGKIMDIVCQTKAWWEVNNSIKEENELGPQNNQSSAKVSEIEKIVDTGNKTYAPQLQYNLMNIISAYALASRVYDGDFTVNYFEAAALVIHMSCVLKDDAKFEGIDEAVCSVSVEAKTLPFNAVCIHDNIKEINVKDAVRINSSHKFKMAALSDTLRLFRYAKKVLAKALVIR